MDREIGLLYVPKNLDCSDFKEEKIVTSETNENAKNVPNYRFYIKNSLNV